MLTHHIKVTILTLAHLVWYSYNQILFWFICVYYYMLNNVEQAIDNADVSIKDLRTPRHIALSLTNECNHLDLASIGRLLCWCKQLGVHYITLYDDLGKLKDRQKELTKQIELQMGLLGCEKPISYIEGLNIISRSDGRQKFVEDVKELIKSKPDSIDINKVQQKVGWSSDPELLISFGTPLCLYGFPPWQLRLTEILSIPTHKNLPQRVFIDCLIRFSKTSQREGA